MCGIALIIGPRAGAQEVAFAAMVEAISSRGEVEETRRIEGALMGTSRLRIVDRDHAIQPWVSEDERHSLCYNGEVFNHAELREELAALRGPLRSVSDTEVVLEALLAWGLDAPNRLRGEFAFALVDHATGAVLLGRDPVGVKPLYWSRVGDHLHVASEVKALLAVGGTIHEVPPGHCGWARPGHDPELAAFVDLLTLGADEPPLTDPDEAAAVVRSTFLDALALRVDTDLPVAIVLSGGLDSSLALINARRFHDSLIAFTVGAPGSPDIAHARRLTTELGVPHVVIDVDPRTITAAEVKEAVRVGELTEYGDAINAVVSLRLFRAIHEAGLKVAITGDGSDEIFGGYGMYAEVAPERARHLFAHKLGHLARTELQRVDRTSMGCRVEVRVPFLDIEMLRIAMRIPVDLKVRDGYEKWILRRAFAPELPDHIAQRHKNPMSHSSGLHERIRLYRPLMHRWYREFGYDRFEPMRRDFSIALSQHGHSLDATLASPDLRADYTPMEVAKDFLGAIRGNVRARRAQRSST